MLTVKIIVFFSLVPYAQMCINSVSEECTSLVFVVGRTSALKWRRQIPLKQWEIYTNLYHATFQKTEVFIKLLVM
jgi:hypothetical protein